MMRYNRKYLILLLSCFLLMTAFPLRTESAVDLSYGDNDTIESNPEYIPRSDEPDSTDEDASDVEEDVDVDEDADIDAVSSKKKNKSMLAKALANTRPKNAIKLVKKHKTIIIFALVIYAFRKELLHVMHRLISSPVYDPKSGNVIGRTIRVNPTAILKLILFLQFMWRTFRSGEGVGESPHMLPMDHAPGLFTRLRPHVYVPTTEQHWTFERVNERYHKDALALQKAMGEIILPHSNYTNSPMSISSVLREAFQPRSVEANGAGEYNGTVIVMDMTDLSTAVTQMESIRDQVSFLLSQHQANQTRHIEGEAQMEIVVLLESPGGGAADYGLAAQQLLRLRNAPGIRLTICVDKVAASGGYMMAATGHEILAAPFAMVGSIGVYGQTINIHQFLENYGVKDLIFRAGKNKAPLGLIGEVTQAGMNNIQSMIDKTHAAFKYHVASVRPALHDAIDDVATGDVWLGYDAIDVGLVDRLVTSDEYIGERMKEGARVLKLIRYQKPTFGFLTSRPSYAVAKLVHSIASQLKQSLVENVKDSEATHTTIHTRSFDAQTVQTKSPIN